MPASKTTPNKFRDNLLTLLGVVAVSGSVAYVLCWHVLAPAPGPEFPLGNHNPPREDRLKTRGTALQRDLANGVFRAGDSLDGLVAKHPPLHRIDHPPFVTLLYAEGSLGRDTLEWFLLVTDVPTLAGVKVAARDGRLVAALTREERVPPDQDEVRVLFLDLSGDWLGEYGDTLFPALLQPHAAVVGVWVHPRFQIPGCGK